MRANEQYIGQRSSGGRALDSKNVMKAGKTYTFPSPWGQRYITSYPILQDSTLSDMMSQNDAHAFYTEDDKGESPGCTSWSTLQIGLF